MNSIRAHSFLDRPPESEVAGDRRRSLARALLVTVIAALCVAALVAIGLLLFGDFGDTEGKILLTTLAIAGYNLLGLASTTALGRKPTWLGPLGLAVSAIGFVLYVALIWTNPDGDLLGRLVGTLLVLAIAIGHAALLLLLTRGATQRSVVNVRRATLVASPVLSAMIIIPMLSGWEPGGTYFRLLGADAVLTVLGTLLVPVLWKLAGGSLTLAAEPAGRDQLEMRYKGRTFVIETSYRTEPPVGFVVSAWEVIKGRHESVADLANLEPQPDSHTALAAAVRQITTLVDTIEPPQQSITDLVHARSAA